MKAKSIAVLVAIAAMIVAIVALPVKPGDIAPQIADNTQFGDGASLGIGISESDAPQVDESTSSSIDESATLEDLIDLELAENVDVRIDEDGSKHYSLTASDSPQVKSKP